jgi:hypothetical protein
MERILPWPGRILDDAEPEHPAPRNHRLFTFTCRVLSKLIVKSPGARPVHDTDAAFGACDRKI